LAALTALLCLSAHPASAQFLQPDRGNLERGTLPAHWYSRLALRDFSIWPSGPSFESPAEDAAFKKRVDQQRAEMWDHDKQ
jgi:hypothetical protein